MSLIYSLARSVLGLVLRRPVLGVVMIPIQPDGQVVLVRRRDNGLWSLPGGLVEWGEDIVTAARRELAEETGLELLRVDRLVGVYSAPDRDPRLHSVCVAIALSVQGTLHIHDTLELTEIGAFSMNALPDSPLAHDHQQLLQDYRHGKTVVK